MNYGLIRNILGKIILLLAIFMILPIFIALYYREPLINIISFLVPGASLALIGLLMTIFKAKNTKILINVIALATDNASITLDGNLHIDKNINNIEARLYEETLLLWDAKYISLIPWLRVDSPDVIASHWAKIQRISPERIFYMQSRWLDEKKAIDMIINSY